MRSLWLDWPNSRQIIENARRDEVSKPTKPGFGSFVSSLAPSFSITRAGDRGLPVNDPYAERMGAALRQIAGYRYRRGMILWLETARPELYAELIADIPDEISRLWNERAPLESFETLLARLISLHRRCCDLHLTATTWSNPVPKTFQADFGTLSAGEDAK